MPTVPGGGLREVAPRPIASTPDPGRGATLGAFGGFEAEALSSVGQASQQISNTVRDIQVRRNKMSLEEGDIAYTSRVREVLHGTEDTPGFFSRSGKDAVDASPQVAEQIKAIREDVIEEHATNPQQQRQLSAMLKKREGRHATNISKYHEQQLDIYETTLNEARMQEAISDATIAYNDPDLIRQSQVIIESTVHDMAEQNGWDGEITNRKLSEARTSLFDGVVRSAMKRKDFQAARDLFSKFKSRMDGPIAAQLSEDMEQLSLIGEAQQEFDRYMASELPEEDVIDAIRQDLVDQPELRDEVVKRVSNEFSRKQRAQKRVRREAKREAFNLIAHPDDPRTVDEVLEEVDEDTRDIILSDGNLLRNLFQTEKLVAEAEIYATSSDGTTYPNAKKLPLSELADLNPNEFLGELTRSEHNKLATDIANAQRKLESGRDTAARILDNQEADLTRTLKGNTTFFDGSDPTPEFNQVITDLRNWVYEQVDEQGRVPGDQELKQKAAEFSTIVEHDTSWLPFTEDQSVIRDLNVEQAQVARVDFDDIRPELKRVAEEELIAANQDATDENLMEEYVASRTIAQIHPDPRVKKVARERAMDLLGISIPAQQPQTTRPAPSPQSSLGTTSIPPEGRTQSRERSNLLSRIEENEGRRSQVYLDSRGIPTVGVGFNLQRSDARQKVEAVGADYDKVLSGEQSLTDEQMNRLLEQDLDTARKDAKTFVSNFDDLSRTRQSALVDMAFNMGRTTLGDFRETKKAIENGQFDKAARQILQSRYAQQVPHRAARNARMIREG